MMFIGIQFLFLSVIILVKLWMIEIDQILIVFLIKKKKIN